VAAGEDGWEIDGALEVTAVCVPVETAACPIMENPVVDEDAEPRGGTSLTPVIDSDGLPKDDSSSVLEE
jgi:hypothetical protein